MVGCSSILPPPRGWDCSRYRSESRYFPTLSRIRPRIAGPASDILLRRVDRSRAFVAPSHQERATVFMLLVFHCPPDHREPGDGLARTHGRWVAAGLAERSQAAIAAP